MAREHHVRELLDGPLPPLAIPATLQDSLMARLDRLSTVKAVAFSSDGQYALTGSDDKSARLWRVATRQPVGEPLLHQNSVESLAFAHDGRTAYTGDLEGKVIRRWDPAPCRLSRRTSCRASTWATSTPTVERT